MKSLVNKLLVIAQGLCKDVRAAYPQYEGVDRDFARLALTCQTRGLGFFSLDLPNLDTILIDGLENGRLVLEGPVTTPISKRVKVPRLFSGLWLRVFDKTGCLLEDPDVTAIFFLRQLCCLGKKVQTKCSPARMKNAVEEYYATEEKILNPTLAWKEDRLDPNNLGNIIRMADIDLGELPLFPHSVESVSPHIRDLLEKCQRVADIILSSFSFYEPVRYSSELESQGKGTSFRHGPGVVADRKGNRINKYDMPRWSAKLEQWFPYRQCGTIATDTDSKPLNHEVASRLIAVPKTAKSPRLIAAEPTEHQWCQQSIRHFMVRELQSLFGEEFICFERQDLSGHMAVQGSLDRSLATIDLSSASDRLSCWLVERVFRKSPSLLHALHATRTRYIKVDDNSFISLKKFASQGTATTFPVQTLVFLIIALSACIKGDVSWTSIRRLRGKVRVFGDDIIVPNDRYDDVTSLLQVLGLKVNMEKSFHKGFFRESCGSDAYKGYDITPVKPREVMSDGPASRQAVIDTANNFHKKGLWNAAAALESTLGNHLLRRLPVVGRDCCASGRFSFTGRSTDHLDTRWNVHLHRQEFRVWKITSSGSRVPTGERFALLQFFTEAPYSQDNWEHGIAERPRPRDGTRWCALY